MNSDNNKNRPRNQIKQTHGSTSAHPKGGFVAWPDGHTSRTGECRTTHAVSPGEYEERKGFVAWPEEPQEKSNRLNVKRTSMKQITNETTQQALGAGKAKLEVNENFLYSLVFAGRITLKDYLRSLGERAKERVRA